MTNTLPPLKIAIFLKLVLKDFVSLQRKSFKFKNAADTKPYQNVRERFNELPSPVGLIGGERQSCPTDWDRQPKSPQDLGGDKLSLSSKIFEIIDLTTIEQTIYHMEIYEDLFAEGECWASGDAKEPTIVIPVESLSYKNYLF